PECGIEYKYCLTCGTTLKVEIVPKIDVSLLPEEQATPSAATQPSVPLSINDLAEMDEDEIKPKKEKTAEELEKEQYPDETPEERKRRKLREKALDLLRSSRESTIKGASWKHKTPPGGGIDFDVL
ncbi:MAG: hypothetical protein QGH40_12530, partial [bacterium]|nr:hypothetical protein [bacterium]